MQFAGFIGTLVIDQSVDISIFSRMWGPVLELFCFHRWFANFTVCSRLGRNGPIQKLSPGRDNKEQIRLTSIVTLKRAENEA